MKSIEDVVAELPERGWATVREVNPFIAVQMMLEEYAHVQYTPIQGVYQMRLTQKGRATKKEVAGERA